MKRILYFPDYKCSDFGLRVESLVSCRLGDRVANGNYSVSKVSYPPSWHTDLAFYTVSNKEERFILTFDSSFDPSSLSAFGPIDDESNGSVIAAVLNFIRNPGLGFDYLIQKGVKYDKIEQPAQVVASVIN